MDARTILWGGLATAFILIPGVIVGVAVGQGVIGLLPGHSGDLNLALAAIAVLVGLLPAGALWGWALSRITHAASGRRLAVAGGIGFAPTTVVVVLALTFFENVFVEQRQGPDLPIHNIFTMLFVPAAAILAGVTAFALGIGAQTVAAAARLAVTCGLSAGLAFLVVNLALDGLGWRVGAPGAEQRATMLTTALLGNLAAAFAGGAVIGRTLARRSADGARLRLSSAT